MTALGGGGTPASPPKESTMPVSLHPQDLHDGWRARSTTSQANPKVATILVGSATSIAMQVLLLPEVRHRPPRSQIVAVPVLLPLPQSLPSPFHPPPPPHRPPLVCSTTYAGTETSGPEAPDGFGRFGAGPCTVAACSSAFLLRLLARKTASGSASKTFLVKSAGSSG